jgi:hypothetical protein
MAKRMDVVLSETLTEQLVGDGLQTQTNPDALRVFADKLGLYLPRKTTALLHLPDEEPPVDLLPKKIALSALIVPVDKLTTEDIRTGFIDRLHAMRADEQAEHEKSRDVFNRGLEFVGMVGGLVIAGRSESGPGQLLGAGMAVGSMAIRAYTYFHPLEMPRIDNPENYASPVEVASKEEAH